MNQDPQNKEQNKGAPENDPVWNLLDQAPPAKASGVFLQNTLRATRLQSSRLNFWQRFNHPIIAVPTLAALVICAYIALQSPSESPAPSLTMTEENSTETTPNQYPTSQSPLAQNELQETTPPQDPTLPSTENSPQPSIETVASIDPPEVEILEEPLEATEETDWLDESLLVAAADQPDLFSDEELVAMIF